MTSGGLLLAVIGLSLGRVVANERDFRCRGELPLHLIFFVHGRCDYETCDYCTAHAV